MILTKVMSTSNLVDQQFELLKKGLRFIATLDNSSICLNKIGNPARFKFLHNAS